LNADTHPDLAVVDSASGDVTTLLGDGRGHFVVKATNVTVNSIPRSVAVADFDADGIKDLATASFSASTVSVLRGNDDGSGKGDGTFQPAVDFWSGDAPSGLAVGNFDGDARPDIVVASVRNDTLSLLRNDSPHPGDGVVIERDIYYRSPAERASDLFAVHHMLDVYTPPKGTASFAGKGKPYPVVVMAHGGAGVTGGKTMLSYLARSLALEGIVAVSTNYQLGSGDAVEDVAQAFRWTRDNVGSTASGGDRDNMFVVGMSAGGAAIVGLATGEKYGAEQKDIRGLVLAGGSNQAQPGPAVKLPPSLLTNGDEGLERGLAHLSASFSAEAKRRGAESTHVVVNGRDHLTIVSDMALADDPARVALRAFVRRHIDSNP
jgi:acetyl esterase/lipase